MAIGLGGVFNVAYSGNMVVGWCHCRCRTSHRTVFSEAWTSGMVNRAKRRTRLPVRVCSELGRVICALSPAIQSTYGAHRRVFRHSRCCRLNRDETMDIRLDEACVSNWRGRVSSDLAAGSKQLRSRRAARRRSTSHLTFVIDLLYDRAAVSSARVCQI